MLFQTNPINIDVSGKSWFKIMEMKPVVVLKRKSSDETTQFELCLFCQLKKTDKPREA